MFWILFEYVYGCWMCGCLILLPTTSVRVPRKAKIILCSSKIFFLCKNAFKWAIAQLSNQLGTIFRVRLKFALNHHWNLFFHDANFIFLIQIYGNFKVTLKMVPDWFDSRAMAHLNAFLQRKNIFEEQSLILAFLGTLTDVLYTPLCRLVGWLVGRFVGWLFGMSVQKEREVTLPCAYWCTSWQLP